MPTCVTDTQLAYDFFLLKKDLTPLHYCFMMYID